MEFQRETRISTFSNNRMEWWWMRIHREYGTEARLGRSFLFRSARWLPVATCQRYARVAKLKEMRSFHVVGNYFKPRYFCRISLYVLD